MTTLIFAFLLMLLVVAGMAIGVAFGRKPIAGSCGGMGALGINAECEICGGNPSRCTTNSDSIEVTGNSDQAENLAYPARTDSDPT